MPQSPSLAAPSRRTIPPEALLGHVGVKAIGLASEAEANWARLDEKLSDPLLHRLWMAVSVRQEALASAAIDGHIVDAEQLCRAQRDPSAAKAPFRLAVDALNATRYAVANDPIGVGVEEWLEVEFRRARLRTADFADVDVRKVAFTPSQHERAAAVRALIFSKPSSPGRLGVFGMTVPARRILEAVDAIGELHNADIEPGRREAAEVELEVVDAVERIGGRGGLAPGMNRLSGWTSPPGKQVGRLLLAWMLRRAIGARHVIPLLSTEFRKNSKAAFAAQRGDEWPLLWLTMVAIAAEKALQRAERIQSLHRRWLRLIGPRRADSVVPAVLEELFALPYLTTSALRGEPTRPCMGLQTAQDVLNLLLKLGIIQDTKSAIAPRVYEASGVVLLP